MNIWIKNRWHKFDWKNKLLGSNVQCKEMPDINLSNKNYSLKRILKGNFMEIPNSLSMSWTILYLTNLIKKKKKNPQTKTSPTKKHLNHDCFPIWWQWKHICWLFSKSALRFSFKLQKAEVDYFQGMSQALRSLKKILGKKMQWKYVIQRLQSQQRARETGAHNPCTGLQPSAPSPPSRGPCYKRCSSAEKTQFPQQFKWFSLSWSPRDQLLKNHPLSHQSHLQSAISAAVAASSAARRNATQQKSVRGAETSPPCSQPWQRGAGAEQLENQGNTLFLLQLRHLAPHTGPHNPPDLLKY